MKINRTGKNAKVSFDFSMEEVKLVIDALNELRVATGENKADELKTELQVWTHRVKREWDGDDIAYTLSTSKDSFSSAFPDGAIGTENFEKIANMFNELSEYIELGDYLTAKNQLLKIITEIWENDQKYYNLEEAMKMIIRYKEKYITFDK